MLIKKKAFYPALYLALNSHSAFAYGSCSNAYGKEHRRGLYDEGLLMIEDRLRNSSRVYDVATSKKCRQGGRECVGECQRENILAFVGSSSCQEGAYVFRELGGALVSGQLSSSPSSSVCVL